MGIGTNAKFGYAIEGAYGTVTAPTIWVPMKDASGDLDPALIYPELMGQGRDVIRYALRGEQKTRGSVKINLFPDMGVDFLVGALNIAGGGTGTFLPTPILPSYTLQLQKDDIQTYNLAGSMVDKLSVKAPAGKEVEIDVSFFSQDMLQAGAPGTPAYTASQPASFTDAVVTLGGVADDNVTNLEFDIANHLVEQWTLRSSPAPRRVQSGKLITTGKLTKYFADDSLWLAMRALTSQSLSIAFSLGTAAVTWTFPRAIISMNKQPVKLGQFIVQEIDFHAGVDAALGASVQLSIA